MKSRKIKLNLLILLLFTFTLCGLSKAESFTLTREIKWQIIEQTSTFKNKFDKRLTFEDASIKNNLPWFEEKMQVSSPGSINAVLKLYTYEECDGTMVPDSTVNLPTEFLFTASLGMAREIPFAIVRGLPFRRNMTTGRIEKLTSFTLEITNSIGAKINEKVVAYKTLTHSKLSEGTWIKLGVTQSGVYKLDYNYLKSIGFDPNTINPKNISIYGKPSGMLPQKISILRDTDLVENPIEVRGESDGKFDNGDLVLFYAQSQTTWEYNKLGYFTHQQNYYSDTSWYFITIGKTQGKRIQEIQNNTNTSDITVNTYDDYALHELDAYTKITDEILGGRTWWGEVFNTNLSQDFSFNFPNIDVTKTGTIRLSTSARSFSPSSFTCSINNKSAITQTIKEVSDDFEDTYSRPFTSTNTFQPDKSSINVNLKYNQSENNSTGWLDFIEINVKSKLQLNQGKQINFRNTELTDSGKIMEFSIQNNSGSIHIWDVSDFHNVATQKFDQSGSTVTFKTVINYIKEFVAFDDASLKNPELAQTIPNQDLRATEPIDMVIFTHPDFIPQAKELADFHKKEDGLNSLIVTPQQVYNEFSGGSQDVSAIRDFMKMLYDRDKVQGKAPQYLILFGDASFDYKNRIKGNTNFIPTYEGFNSTDPIGSFCSDDYFGFLDDNEGWTSDAGSDDLFDISVGRLPVKNHWDADNMVDKIKRYYSEASMRDWRNIITMVGDDQNYNGFLNDCESLANYVRDNYPVMNLEKIYFDAYKQVSGASGARYPAAKADLNKRIDAGSLIVNYIGHGGEIGLSHERVVEMNDINGWNNTNALALFITATCELSRFDDPGRVSAGEINVLNPYGGAIAMFTTTRIVNTFGNGRLTNNLFRNNMLNKFNGAPKTLGQIFTLAKDRTGSDENTRNFTLLGDPALRLALPQYQVITTKVDNKDTNSSTIDSFKALGIVSVEGFIADANGKKINNFNGTIYPTVYDQTTRMQTLANDSADDEPSYKQDFYVQKNKIYKGKASVDSGNFSFTFVVPKDITYLNGKGKISYYAMNGNDDAHGLYTNFIVGGVNPNATKDENPPEITLYINDTNFKDGGIVDSNPVLIARISDDIGINTVGGGVGHELTGTLTNGEPIILNDFYESILNNYKVGEINYPFNNLSEGSYNLKVKVWDVSNNPTEAIINFVVISADQIKIEKLFNFPNPLTDKTTFSFEHNKPNQELVLTIDIFNMKGQKVKTLSEKYDSPGTRSASIEWNGTDDLGAPLSNGVYPYRLTIKSSDGKIVSSSNKLLIIH